MVVNKFNSAGKGLSAYIWAERKKKNYYYCGCQVKHRFYQSHMYLQYLFTRNITSECFDKNVSSADKDSIERETGERMFCDKKRDVQE